MPHGSFLASALALVVVATACAAPPGGAAPGSSQSPAAAPSTPKRLTTAIRGDPKSLSEPISNAAGGSSIAGVREIEQMINSGLLVLDSKGELRAQLAESVPTLQNGLWRLLPDGRMETSWTLKPNLTWHDGKQVTSDDFLFTATYARDKAVSLNAGQAFGFVDTIEAPDARTIKATWKSTYADADKLFSLGGGSSVLAMPKHLLEAAYNEDKANFAGSPYFGVQYVGNGPYRVKDWVLGSHLVLEANDRYMLGRPKIDQIEVKFILDTNTLTSNVLAGAVQLTLGRGLTPEQAITMRDQWKEGTVDAGLQNTTSLYPQMLNADPPQMTDVRFRRALLHAIDRQQIVDTFTQGIMPVAYSAATPDDPEYEAVQSQIVRYPYDPRRSAELLESMGLPKDSGGFYMDPASGKRISVEIRTRAHVLREQIQQVLADDWGKVGLVGQPLVVAEQNVNDRAYQATFPSFYFRFGGLSQIGDWVSRATPTPENNFVGSNTMRYRNPEYDALSEKFVGTIERPQRLQLLGEMIRHTTEQLLPMPLYHEPEPVFIGNRVLNAGGRHGSSNQTWNVHEWDLK